MKQGGDIRLFGLIGRTLEHSFSVDHFANKFQKEGIEDARYEAFPLAEISEFPRFLDEHPELIGLNVTIPYKEAVIPYLDELSETAQDIGSVNTIRLSKGIKEGFNTDAEGFEKEITPLLTNSSKKAMVLGTGGASKAVRYVLEKLDYELHFVSRESKGDRRVTYDELTATEVAEQELIVNTTPLGTWPDTDQAPPIPYEGIAAGTLLYDLIYNPPLTRFLRWGKARGARVKNGHGMLKAQAEAAWRIWTETTI